MTDLDLIAALGWEPCQIGTTTGAASKQVWCSAHFSVSTADATQPCNTMFHRLIGARAGIDLARTGIGATLRADADRIDQEAKGSDAPGPLMVAATHQRRSAAMVEGWQP